MKVYQNGLRLYPNSKEIRTVWISLYEGCRQIKVRRVWDVLRKDGLRTTIRYPNRMRSLRLCFTLDNLAWFVKHGIVFSGVVPAREAYLVYCRKPSGVYPTFIKSQRREPGLQIVPTHSDILSCCKLVADRLSDIAPFEWKYLLARIDTDVNDAEDIYSNTAESFVNVKRI